jgi:WD40 repeat protein/serine/threonine protein kinase
MEPDKSLQNLFNAALERSGAAERARFLDEACGADAALRERVEKLLRAHEEIGGFMAQPSRSPAGLGGNPLTEKPGDRIGRYKLLQQIGEGGCGVVYMAEQEEPVRRRVALKVIKLGMDTKGVVARFEAERQALALMDHPNIAKVFDGGATETGRPYFVMELVRGVKITDFCDENKLSAEDRLKLFIQVCQAIQHAHQKGVIHRDIKPSNILVTINDGMPVPKVIDFGIAKATVGRLTDQTLFTAFEQFIGTPAYMSPEQAVLTSLDIDTRSDIYSLGVLLYELLTGSPPFDQKELLAAGLDEMRRTIREVEPVKPSRRLTQELVAAHRQSAADSATEHGGAPPRRRYGQIQELIHVLSGDLDWIVMKCLEKDRARRYETANALAADIRRHLDCEPVVARPPSRWYEFQKTVRRHKFGFGAAGAVMMALATGLGISTWQFVLKNQAYLDGDAARRLADQARQDERRLNFQMAFDRGLDLCEQGHVASGMLWLARALELTPPDEPAMQRVIRANLNAWRRELHSLTGIYPREQGVVSGAFSPDGNWVLTGGYDGVAQLWDRRTSSVAGDPLRHATEAHTAIFSSDGEYILTTSTDKTARLWETKSHQLIRAFPHGSAVWAGVFSKDGRIITGNSKGEIQVWDRDQEKPMAAWRHPVPHGIHDLALSPDGKQVLGACDDGIVLLWDLQTHQVVARFVGHTGRVPTATFVTTNRIASGDIDGNVFLWTWPQGEGTVNGERIGKPWKHRGGVHRLRVNEPGDQLLTASYDRTAQLLNSATGEPIGVPFEHQGALRDVAFGKDGSILTCSEDDAARAWQPAPGCLDKVWRRDAGVQHVLFTADAKHMLVRNKDRTALVRNVLTDEVVGMPFTPETGVHQFAVSSDESKVMTAAEDGPVQFWKTATGLPLGEAFRHGGGTWTVAISQDGKLAVSGGLDGVVKLWDARLGRPLRTVLAISNAPIRGLAFSPDGSRVVIGAGDKLAWILGTDDWSVKRKLEGHHGSVMTVAFSPDGRRVATGSFDNTVIVWDAETGLPISKPMRHRGPFWYAVAFSKDGRTVVTGCDDATAQIWDIETSRPIGPMLPHDAALRTAVFAENDHQIITGTSIGTTYIWNVSTAPLESEVERIVLGLQVSTGMELDADGEIRPLTPETWRQRRERLAAMGGNKVD